MVFLSPFSVSPPPRWPLCTHKGNRWIKKHAMSWGPGHGTDFLLLRMRFHSLYFDILCTYSQKGSKIDPTFKSRMYRMFPNFQNLDGNIYSWNLYVYVCFPKPRMVPGWGNCCWLWRSLRMATISAWKVKGRFRFRWEILTQFIEKWWIKYEKLCLNGFDHHKWRFQ